MTDARQELTKFRLLSMRAEQLRQRIDRLEAVCGKVTTAYNMERVQGGQSNKEDLIIQLADIRQDSQATLLEYAREYDRISKKINLIDDPLLAEILLQRYVDGKLWMEIAEVINYSEDHTRGRLHGKALEAYKQVNTNVG